MILLIEMHVDIENCSIERIKSDFDKFNQESMMGSIPGIRGAKEHVKGDKGKKSKFYANS